MSVDAPAERDDRIGAGGITASHLLADIARQRQASIDRLIDTVHQQTAYDSEGLREQNHD